MVITSYQLRISCHVCGSTSSCMSMLVKIVLVSVTGMLEYRFVMSKEARVWCGSSGVSLRFCIRSWVFFMVKAWGRGDKWLIVLVNSFDNW